MRYVVAGIKYNVLPMRWAFCVDRFTLSETYNVKINSFANYDSAYSLMRKLMARPHKYRHGEYTRPIYFIVREQDMVNILADDKVIDWSGCTCTNDIGAPCGYCMICREYIYDMEASMVRRMAVTDPIDNIEIQKMVYGVAI